MGSFKRRRVPWGFIAQVRGGEEWARGHSMLGQLLALRTLWDIHRAGTLVGCRGPRDGEQQEHNGGGVGAVRAVRSCGAAGT